MAKPTTPAEAPAPKRRRADADRSVAAILDAALEALASDPDSSMSEIARRAGVVTSDRSTSTFRRARLSSTPSWSTRSALVVEAMKGAEPQRGEPVEALERVLRATWRQLAQFHGSARAQHGPALGGGAPPASPSRCSTSWSL